MPNGSLSSPSRQLENTHQPRDDNNISANAFSSLPSLRSLPSIDVDSQSIQHDIPLRMHSTLSTSNENTNDSSTSKRNTSSEPPTQQHNTTTQPSSLNKRIDNNGQRIPQQQLVWGHVRSFSAMLGRFMFKDNNLPLILNMLGHLLAARQLWWKSGASVTRYTNLPSSTVSRLLMADQFRSAGVLHLALGLLAAMALKERRLSTERTALWVLSVATWCQSFVQAKAYLQSPTLYTLKALQEWGTLNGFLTLITTIALRNTIRRTGRLL